MRVALDADGQHVWINGVEYLNVPGEEMVIDLSLDVARLERAIRASSLPLMYADESYPLESDWPDYARDLAAKYAADVQVKP